MVIHKNKASPSPPRKHHRPPSSPGKKSPQSSLKKALEWTAKTDANRAKFTELRVSSFIVVAIFGSQDEHVDTEISEERHLNIERTAKDLQQNNGREEIRQAIIEKYPHLFGGHENEVRVDRAMDFVTQYHSERRWRKSSCTCRRPFEAEEGDQDQNGDLVVDNSALQSTAEHLQSQGPRNPSPSVSDSSLILVTSTPGETNQGLDEKDTLTKFLESCDPPMVLVDCDKQEAILQQVVDGAHLKKALTQIHILFLLRNLGFPLA